MAVRVALLHSSGIVVNVFMADDANPAIGSGEPDSEGRLTIAHADAQVGDRVIKGECVPRMKSQKEIAYDAELAIAKAVDVVNGEAKVG